MDTENDKEDPRPASGSDHVPGADNPGVSSDASATASLLEILGRKFRAGRTEKTLVYHFCIDDHDWTLVVGSEAFQWNDGKPASADCYLKTSREILIGTVRGEYKPSFADFLTGKIRSTNPQLLLTLKEVFSGE